MKKTFLITILFFALILRILIIDFGLPSKNLALTTYNPDEPLSYYTIEQWKPKKLYFHPQRVFLWGGFHLYPLAASLGFAKVSGFIKFGNRDFYINNLKEADKLYLVGRLLMILFSLGSIYLIYLIGLETYGLFSAFFMSFLLTIAPLHVFNSIYVRPDIMMMFFGVLSIYFGIKILKTQEFRYYILCCASIGFATGAKLSGAVYGIIPLIAHLLSDKDLKNKIKDIKLYIIPVLCLIFFLLSSPYVIIDFNRTPDSFLSYLKQNISLSQGSMDLGQVILLGYGPLSYIKHYLRYGLGSCIVVLSLVGTVLMIYNIVRNKNKFDLLLLSSGIIILFVISATKNQTVWYTFPVIPFIVIYSARGIDIIFKSKNKISFLIGILLIITLSVYTTVYMFSGWKLYYSKNVREECSNWIEKNVPQKSKIAIARSYFWTPGILRKYNPPYKVLMGSDPVHSSVQDGVLGLKNYLDETEYIVLTEYEFRWGLHPKLKKYYPEHAKILEEIFYSGKFQKLSEFDKQAQFLWFKFNKNYPPGDWLIPNPKIVVFRKT